MDRSIPTTTNDQVFDLTYLQELSQGDKEFEVEMIRIFIAEVPQSLAELRTALKSEDWEACGKIVHKLKSKLRIMGLHSVKDAITEIELNFKKAQNLPVTLKSIHGLLPKMEGFVDRAKQMLAQDYEVSDC